MRELLRGVLSITLHLFAGFLLCFLYAFFFMKEAPVLPPLLFKWKVSEAILLFIKIIPMLICSSFIFGYALIFGRCGQNTVYRYSPILLRYLRDALIILLLCMAAYFGLSEFVQPTVLHYQTHAIQKTTDYDDFFHLGRNALRDKDYETAYAHIKSALTIWKDSKDALELFDLIKMKVNNTEFEQKYTKKNNEVKIEQPLESLTSEAALRLAEHYRQTQDFYTAHFYAMQAYRLSPPENPLRQESLRMAAQAWNQIEAGLADLKADFDIDLYAAKKEAYMLIQEGDAVEAYYRFLNLQKAISIHNPRERDPDVDRFLKISHKKLLNKAFFIDETLAVSVFEAVRNIHFTVESPSMKKTAFRMDGLSRITKNGITDVYGRNCEIVYYADDNRVESKIFVPFIKCLPVVDIDGTPKVQFLLQAVDRTDQNVKLNPRILSGKPTPDQLSVLLLPFSFADFELIIAACEGEKTMRLLELYSFRNKSALYGFDPKVYNREILSRVIGNPFSVLIVAIYLLILAWRFRIPQHTPFKWYWIFGFPLFVYTSWFLIDTVQFAARLIIACVTDFSYAYSSILVTTAFIALFFLVSFLFFAQRSNYT